jgi:hypothetical protein
MNAKNFIIATVLGFIVYFALGAIFYGMLFSSFFPHNENEPMAPITIGCFMSSAILAYIFTHIGGASSSKSALINGGIIGCLVGAAIQAFSYSVMPMETISRCIDICLSFAMGALTSYVIWFVLSKLNPK